METDYLTGYKYFTWRINLCFLAGIIYLIILSYQIIYINEEAMLLLMWVSWI